MDKKVILGVILILLFLFYWYQWKPARDREDCYQQTFGLAYNRIEENKRGNKEWAQGKEWTSNPEKDWSPDGEWGWWYPHPKRFGVEYQFAACLNSKGIKTPFPK
jgi:hypothetical protein